MLVFLDESGFVCVCLLPSNTTFRSPFYFYLVLIVNWSHLLFCYQDKRLKRTYGYSPIGKRAQVKHMAQNWGPRITAIPVICTEGMIDLGLYQGNVNGATFEDFVDEKLCPNLLPFNGINPRSVVIMGTRESLAPFRILI